jgi:hypothetical protein
MALLFWYVQGLLTPIIAFIALYITCQQWKTNVEKLRMDLYDRRFKVFQEIRQFLLLMSNTKCELNDLISFDLATAEADFLFGPEIRQLIQDIYGHGAELLSAKRQYDHVARQSIQTVSQGYDHQEVVGVLSTEQKWAIGQIKLLKEKFSKYLNINIQTPKQSWLSKFIPT